MDKNLSQKGAVVHNTNYLDIIDKNINHSYISDIPASPSLNYSKSSELDESFLILQPTNSILSVMPDSDHLISSIRSKNEDLQHYCAEKLNDLRNTTKEFCAANNSQTLRKSETEDSTEIKIESKSNKTIETIISEIALLQSKLSEANQRLKTNESEISIHNSENEILITRVRKILQEKDMQQDINVVCNCTSF